MPLYPIEISDLRVSYKVYLHQTLLQFRSINMNKRDWLMSDYNMSEKPIDTYEGITESERASLSLLRTQVIGWSNQDIDTVVSVMADDGVYHDITLDPAIGHDAIRKFGGGWLEAVPDLDLYIEAYSVQGNIVSDMGWMSGTITKEYFGMPATGKRFDVQFSQMAFIANEKIQYLRGFWNAPDMYNQIGWSLDSLKR